MANQGYRGESYGRDRDIDDDERKRGFGADRERSGPAGLAPERERGWDPAREGWGSGFGGGERERGSDFSRGRGEWAEREGSGDRGMFDRARNTARSWLSDDGDEGDRWRSRGGEHRTGQHGREHGTGGFQGDFGGGRGQSGFGGSGDWGGGRQGMSPRREDSFGYNDLAGTTGGFGNQRFGSTPHDHYLSWRERQIAELDRDYQEYCREREQSFHQDFDSWRQSRRSQQGEAVTGSGQGADTPAIGEGGSTGATGASAPQEPLELTDASSAATLGAAETPRGGRSRS